MECRQCGEPAKDGQDFCMKCGARIDKAQPQRDDTPRFCWRCGAKAVMQGQAFCPHCGAPSAPDGGMPRNAEAQGQVPGPGPAFAPGPQQPAYAPGPSRTAAFTPKGYVKTSQDYTLRLVAAIINLVFCVLYGFGGPLTFASGDFIGFLMLICLAWMIPMTVYSWRISTGEKPNGTTFAIANLIFVNAISGVLLLISHKEA